MFCDIIEGTTLDLNQLIVDHPAATFFMRMSGDAMQSHGIFAGDLLVVNRSLDPKIGNTVIAVVDGELAVVRLSENKELQIWGVVTHVIHKTK
jgi:DNA polymerase V